MTVGFGAATPVLGTDTEVPLHFGNPVAEQERYESGAGLYYAGPAPLVAVTGADRFSWLTTLSTQVIAEGDGPNNTEMLLLDHNGRIEFAAAVINTADTTYLLSETPAELAEYLQSMKFMLAVDVQDRTGEYELFSGVNLPSGVLDRFPAGTLQWVDPWPNVAPGGAQYFQGRHPGADLPTELFLVPTAAADSVFEGADLAPVGSLAAEATRVSAWRPRFSTEVDAKALPAELDWLRTAVHTDKGCYRGQESVARIINLGKPPRRLVFLQLDGSLGSIPAPGDSVELQGRTVGVVTSVARHAEMGPIALALVRRGVDPNATLNIGPIAAAQEIIVSPEGKSDHSPQENPAARLRAQRGANSRPDLRGA